MSFKSIWLNEIITFGLIFFEIGILPKNWEGYLKNSENKRELFPFLARKILESLNVHCVTNVANKLLPSSITPVFPLLITYRYSYQFSLQEMEFPGHGLSGLHNRNIDAEEADGRIMMHVHDMVIHGAKSVLIRCSDTDVLVLGISFYHSLQALGLHELWFLFGTGTHQRYIAAHSIALALGPCKSLALRGFHAFTGCDTVSFFGYKGKLTAWKLWMKQDDATVAFKYLSEPHERLQDAIITILEKFTILLYDSKSTRNNIDEVRKDLFCSGGRPVSMIPPTVASLLQHIRRAAYQAGHVWGCAISRTSIVASPSQWGWIDGGREWLPYWNDSHEVWGALRDLQNCGCKSSCETQRCSCRRFHLPCTPACKSCKGECSNTRYDKCLILLNHLEE